MRKKVKLAIVGRPNVGKSAIFNCICKKRIAIVDEAEGVTRDRIYQETDLFGFPFEVIDTGGINPRSKNLYAEHVCRQAEIAIEEADTIVMVVDGKTGLTNLDVEVSRILHASKKPILLAVNKIDNIDSQHKIHNFYSLGIENIVAVSATQNWQIAELLEHALSPVKEQKNNLDHEEIETTKVAIIGRSNVGKSTLINYILDEERCIVSPLIGTTRDSIDVTFTKKGIHYTFIDTAGIRRKNKEQEVVEKYSYVRTKRALERSDIVILMLDSRSGLTQQEKRIFLDIEKEKKGCLILFNKWDLVKNFRMEHCLRDIEERMPFVKHCPKIMISALSGRNVEKIFPSIGEIEKALKKRITTGELNTFIEGVLQKNHPPMLYGKRLRIYYMSQVGIVPPKFVLFVNSLRLMDESYKKYIYNQLREKYKFAGAPLLLHLKPKFIRK